MYSDEHRTWGVRWREDDATFWFDPSMPDRLGINAPLDQVSLSSSFAISHLVFQRSSGVGIEDLPYGAIHLFLAHVVLSKNV
jgi:hypothetical protein